MTEVSRRDVLKGASLGALALGLWRPHLPSGGAGPVYAAPEVLPAIGQEVQAQWGLVVRATEDAGVTREFVHERLEDALHRSINGAITKGDYIFIEAVGEPVYSYAPPGSDIDDPLNSDHSYGIKQTWLVKRVA